MGSAFISSALIDFESFEDLTSLAMGLETLLLPKEIVFCEPFCAGPEEVRVRRVVEGGIFAGFV